MGVKDIKRDRKRQKPKYVYYNKEHKLLPDYYIYNWFWGFRNIKGKFKIDTKRFKKACEHFNITDQINPNIYRQRNTVYLNPTKRNKNDYYINRFRQLLDILKKEWNYEYKKVIDYSIKNYDHLKSEVFDEDYKMNLSPYYDHKNNISNLLQSIYILRIHRSFTHLFLKIMNEHGLEDSHFDIEKLNKFTEERLNEKVSFEGLEHYNSFQIFNNLFTYIDQGYTTDHWILYDKEIRNKVTNFKFVGQTKYYDIFPGSFIYEFLNFKDDYINPLLDELLVFVEDYCYEVFNEDKDDSKWDYIEYFKNFYWKIRKEKQPY